MIVLPSRLLPAGIGPAMAAANDTVPPGHTDPWRTLRPLALILTVSGTATVHTPHTKAHHRPGTLVLMGPGLRFREITTDQPWTSAYILLSGPMFRDLGLQRQLLSFSPAPKPWLQWHQRMLHACIDKPANWRWQLLTCLFLLLCEACSIRQPDARSEGLVTEVERALGSAPMRQWSVPEMARSVGMNPHTFAHAFAREAGQSPAQWLKARRIESARRLLAAGRSVSETASLLGFANPYHFSRVFRQLTGAAPSHLRHPDRYQLLP